MIAKCANNGCVYWARIQDPTQVTDGTSYYQCGSCWALTHDPSDQHTPVLLPSRLGATPKWQGKVPRVPDIYVQRRIVEHGLTIEQYAARTHGRSDRARPWTAVKKVRMYTKATNQTTEPPSDGACWVPEGR
jgi:hypothetical protein